MSPKTLLTAFVLLSGTFWCSAFQSFCYHDDSCGPSSSRWGGMCQSGKLQSPINITAAHPDEVADTVTIPLHKFGSYAFYVQNNGHTVYVKFNPTGKNSSIFPGRGLTRTKYRFHNLHFNWGTSNNAGSEHTLNGRKYSMEVHLVHFRTDFKNIQAAASSREADALAVFAIFLQVDPKSSPNPSLKPIIKVLPKIREAATSRVKVNSSIDFTQIIKNPGGDTIYAYNGSLTIPGCNQIVTWFVKKDPVKISSSDVAAFRKIMDGRKLTLKTNLRPVQPLNGRHIHIIKTK